MVKYVHLGAPAAALTRFSVPRQHGIRAHLHISLIKFVVEGHIAPIQCVLNVKFLPWASRNPLTTACAGSAAILKLMWRRESRSNDSPPAISNNRNFDFHAQRSTSSSKLNPFGFPCICSSEASHEASSPLRGASSCSETMCNATSIPFIGTDAALIRFVSRPGCLLLCTFQCELKLN